MDLRFYVLRRLNKLPKSLPFLIVIPHTSHHSLKNAFWLPTTDVAWHANHLFCFWGTTYIFYKLVMQSLHDNGILLNLGWWHKDNTKWNYLDQHKTVWCLLAKHNIMALTIKKHIVTKSLKNWFHWSLENQTFQLSDFPPPLVEEPMVIFGAVLDSDCVKVFCCTMYVVFVLLSAVLLFLALQIWYTWRYIQKMERKRTKTSTQSEYKIATYCPYHVSS